MADFPHIRIVSQLVCAKKHGSLIYDFSINLKKKRILTEPDN
jgi:hypothetical protein